MYIEIIVNQPKNFSPLGVAYTNISVFIYSPFARCDRYVFYTHKDFKKSICICKERFVPIALVSDVLIFMYK